MGELREDGLVRIWHHAVEMDQRDQQADHPR